MLTVHERVFTMMKEMANQFLSLGVEMEMPPHSILTNNAVFTEMVEGESLTAEFSFDTRFTNPLKMYQGGFLCALFDDVFGPLTYMVARAPAVTVQMNTTFIRPFTAKDKKIVIFARVLSKSKSLLVLEANARTLDGKLIATANTQSFILNKNEQG